MVPSIQDGQRMCVRCTPDRGRRRFLANFLLLLPAVTMVSCFDGPSPDLSVLRGSAFGLIFMREGDLEPTEKGFRTAIYLRSESGERIVSHLEFKTSFSFRKGYTGVIGVSGDGEKLAAVALIGPWPRMRLHLALLDIVTNKSSTFEILDRPVDFRSSLDESTFLLVQNNGVGRYKFFFRKNDRDWVNFAEITENERRYVVFGISPDGNEAVYANEGSVFVHNLATGRRYKVASGYHASCSPDGQYISYVDSKKRLWIGSLSEPGTAKNTGILAIDGISWSPDSRFGIIARPSSRFALVQIPNDILAVALPEMKTGVITQVMGSLGSNDARWIKHPHRVASRLQRWIDEVGDVGSGVGNA